MPEEITTVTLPPSKQGFWTHKRTYSAIVAFFGGVPTTAMAIVGAVAMTNPILATVFVIAAAGSLFGTVGLAYFGFTATTPITVAGRSIPTISQIVKRNGK